MSINDSSLSQDKVYSPHFHSQTVWQCALATSKRGALVHHSICQIASACIGSIKYWIPIALTYYVYSPTIVPLVTTECIRLLITHNYLIHSLLNYHSSPHPVITFYCSIGSMLTILSSSPTLVQQSHITTRNYAVCFLSRFLSLSRWTSGNAHVECFANKI